MNVIHRMRTPRFTLRPFFFSSGVLIGILSGMLLNVSEIGGYLSYKYKASLVL